MEQRLHAAFLRPGLMERAAALGIIAVAMGTGIMLAGWGISFLWRYTPAEMVVRIANPELRVSQSEPLIVTQDKPFVLAKPEPLKVEPGDLTVKVEPQSPTTSGVAGDAKTAMGEVIRREVTVFSTETWAWERREWLELSGRQRWHTGQSVLLSHCIQS